MKSLFKSIIILCLSASFLLPQSIYAEEQSCTTITYYSKKEWVQQYNLIDGEWDAGMNNFLTSTNILVHANTFGTFANPWMASSKTFNGLEQIDIEATTNPNDQNFFAISFGKQIQIDEIEYQINAQNQGAGKQLNYKLYLNAGMKWVDGVATVDGGELFYESSSSSKTKLNLQGKTVSSITLWFDDYSKDNLYTFNYFQVNTYRVKEHVEWTTEFIEGTETKQVQVCNGAGNFTPDGNGKWEKKSSTIFSPSVNIVSNYVPIVTSQNVSYDACRGNYISAYTQPNCIKGMDTPSQSIRGWMEKGNRPWNTWFSYGAGGTEFPYIQTSTTTGIQYESSPVYWSQNRESNWISGVSSSDSGWCSHTTGSSRTPCYKHTGHSSNSRLNSYDVNVKTYKNVVDPSLRAIKNVKYYLINEDTKKEVFLKEGKEELQTFEFLETGKWRIKAVVTDMTGMTGSKSSNIFYIDNQIPFVTFDPSTDTIVENEGINVQFDIKDNHSGIEKWRVSISKDGGTTWDDFSSFLANPTYKLYFLDAGVYQIKVHAIDKAGNESATFSPLYTIERGTASLGKMVTTVYEMNQSNTLTLKIDNIDIDEEAEVTLKVTCDGSEVFNEPINLNQNQVMNVSYTPSNPTTTLVATLESNGEITIEHPTLTLIANAKTYESKESLSGELEFKAPTVFMVEQGSEQANYLEELKLILRQDKEVYFAGEGIDTKVESTYYNECATIQNWECVGSGTLTTSSASATFYDGAKEVDKIFEKNGEFIVPLEMINNEFVLPFFVASRKEGKIYLDSNDVPTNDTPLDAVRKWHTNQRAIEKLYDYQMNGIDTAVNKFQWLFKSNYEVSGTLKNQYRIRFVDPDNPFPNGESNIWNYMYQWITRLNK
ncbi:hypothetical protein [Anaerorhabdus sp.]|uniref:hypothetical protein n=1 Tax=Anaerorhabdus sp. TaxID=1872524 RepID=UPI002FC8512B